MIRFIFLRVLVTHINNVHDIRNAFRAATRRVSCDFFTKEARPCDKPVAGGLHFLED
jgi:hypothetical protein